MTVNDLIENLQRNLKSGRLEGDEEVMFRDLSVSDAAVDAGSSAWVAADELLIPGDGRVCLGVYE